MAVTLSDTYYLKALDYYPYNLEELIENLNYALSYDEEHSDANCLMGRLQHAQLKNYELAEGYFVNALTSNPCNLSVYRYYSILLIELREYDKALKLINHSYKLKGVNMGEMKRIEGLLAEYQKQYDLALVNYKEARNETFDNEQIDEINSDISRVESKIASSQQFNYSM